MDPASLAMSAAGGGGLASGLVSAGSAYYFNKQNMGLQRETNDMNFQIARETNELNKAMAQQQQDFQERMSNSAYQRATADMRKAGINPMVAFSQGGASTPSGASIAAQNPSPAQAPKATDWLNKGLSSALDTARLGKELGQADSQISLNKATATNQEAMRKLNIASAKTEEMAQRKLKAEIPAVEAESNMRKRQSEIDQKMIEYDNIQKRASAFVGTAHDAVSIFRGRGGGGFQQPNGTILIDKKGEIIRDKTRPGIRFP